MTRDTIALTLRTTLILTAACGSSEEPPSPIAPGTPSVVSPQPVGMGATAAVPTAAPAALVHCIQDDAICMEYPATERQFAADVCGAPLSEGECPGEGRLGRCYSSELRGGVVSWYSSSDPELYMSAVRVAEGCEGRFEPNTPARATTITYPALVIDADWTDDAITVSDDVSVRSGEGVWTTPYDIYVVDLAAGQPTAIMIDRAQRGRAPRITATQTASPFSKSTIGSRGSMYTTNKAHTAPDCVSHPRGPGDSR